MDESIGGKLYFVLFIDYSRCCAVYFMNSSLEYLRSSKSLKSSLLTKVDNALGPLGLTVVASTYLRSLRLT